MRDRDAALARRLEIDRCVDRAGRSDQAQSREAFDDLSRQRRPLAHHAHDVERLQPGNDGIGLGNVIAKNPYVGAPIELRPVGTCERDTLIVVEDGDVYR
jgi:hypothetical protein